MSILLLAGGGAIFLAIAVGVFLLVTAGAAPTGVAKGMQTIDVVYSPPTSVTPADERLRDRTITPAVQQVVSLGKTLTPKSATSKLQRWLDYAGNPVDWPPERVLQMQGVGLVVLAAIGVVASFVLGFGIAFAVVVTLLLAAFGFWLPFILVYNLGLRRQAQIRMELPDAIDLLTLSVEAGMGLEGALTQIAGTMPGEVSREFARMLHEMQMGMRRSDALRAVADRTTVVELRTITTSLVQATELGIPVADVLREQSKEMRVRRRQNAESAAAKVPVKVVFPLVLCLLPALFVVVLGPGVIRIMDSVLSRF